MSGADITIQALADEGVDTIFGYSGGAILPTYDAIFRYNEDISGEPGRGIKLIVPANEQGAGFMAAGYARASGKVGVFLVTSGPGATNCVTPIRDCMADSIPVILIAGQVPSAAMGSDAFQEAPVLNIMSACAKHVFLVTKPEKLEATIRTAFEVAMLGRPGPVVIDLPKDVQNSHCKFRGEGLLSIDAWRKRIGVVVGQPVSDENATGFFEMLNDSERPLVYAGGGVINSNGSQALTDFVERFNLPVVTTLMGIGSIDTSHDLSLHMLGMHGTAYANYAVEDCDMLIAVGSRFDDRVAGKVHEFAPNARNIAHIDVDAAEIGKVKEVSWSHVGDARSALESLVEQGKGFVKDFSPWIGYVGDLRRRHCLNYERGSKKVQPQYVIEVMNEFTKGRAIISTGVGQHQMWAAQYAQLREPRLWLTSGSMGTMGFGLPGAIGAAFACPDRIVVDVDGDGSLRMNLGELETVTTYNLPVKVLILNNFGDGMVRQWQKLYFGFRFSGSDKSLHRKDFVKAAEADGFVFARRLSKKSEVRDTIREFIEFDGPAFLEVMIDIDAGIYPMVGPGMGYKEMITGDHIVSREPNEAIDAEEMSNKPDLF